MDFQRLISAAWHMTWRHRFLWVLALFAGGASAGSFMGGNQGGMQWQTSADEMERMMPGAGRSMEEFGRGIAENPGIAVAFIVLAIAVGVGIAIVSLICQGAMAQATAELARERPITLRQAWDAGRSLFWRYVGLWLILAGIAVVLAMLAAIPLAVFLAPVSTVDGGAPSPAVAGIAIVVTILLMFLLAAVAVALSIVVTYAQRAIVTRDVGPVAALQIAWMTFRGHLGESLLVWMVSLAVTLITSIGAGAALLGVVGLLGGIGVGIWAIAGLNSLTFGYALVAGLAAIATLLVVTGIVNTYFWSYWTLAYLHLAGQITMLQPQPRPGSQPGHAPHPA